VRCSSCGAENPVEFIFCGHCGTELPVCCPRCHLENVPGSAFCFACNTDLPRSSLSLPAVPAGGERRFVVVLFADIAGFTRLSEHLDPEEATALVNTCLDEMTRVVVQHGGRITNYLGDGLMAVFGVPQRLPGDPVRAVRAALAMHERASITRPAFLTDPIALHIGLACGQVVTVRIRKAGGDGYSVIGTSVNLAARLEEVSQPGQILLGECLADLVNSHFSLRLLSPPLPGWDDLRAFELIDEWPASWYPQSHHLNRSLGED